MGVVKPRTTEEKAAVGAVQELMRSGDYGKAIAEIDSLLGPGAARNISSAERSKLVGGRVVALLLDGKAEEARRRAEELESDLVAPESLAAFAAGCRKGDEVLLDFARATKSPAAWCAVMLRAPDNGSPITLRDVLHGGQVVNATLTVPNTVRVKYFAASAIVAMGGDGKHLRRAIELADEALRACGTWRNFAHRASACDAKADALIALGDKSTAFTVAREAFQRWSDAARAGDGNGQAHPRLAQARTRYERLIGGATR